jgi:predicted dehydrogenase
LQVHCEHGSVDMDVAAGTTTIRGAEGLHEKLAPRSEQERADDRFATATNLVDVVLGTAPNGSSGDIGWRAVELLDAAYRSAGNDGAAVRIESLYA